MQIELAPKLRFEAAEIATEVVASLGARGGGKSNGAAVMVEALPGRSRKPRRPWGLTSRPR